MTDLSTSHNDAHGWPERFENVKAGDHLHWLHQGYWYKIRVTKFGMRGPLYYDVVGASAQCHPRSAMPDEAANFWIPPPAPELKSGVSAGRTPQAGRMKLTLRPKMSYLNMLIPKEKQLYDRAAERGMVEISVRRRGLPDRRMLMRKKVCFGKLRYSEALLLGYPAKKLKLKTRGQDLLDTITPEDINLGIGEIVYVELEPLDSPHDAANVA